MDTHKQKSVPEIQVTKDVNPVDLDIVKEEEEEESQRAPVLFLPKVREFDDITV